MSEHEFGVDIAERQSAEQAGKQAEQAQRRMDELFRALIENALDVITILDVEGVIRYQSPSVERVLGYKPAELIGVNIVELLHPDDVSKVNAAIKAAAPPNGTPGIAQVVEARLRHKDGSWRLLEAIGKELPGIPSVTGIVLNSRDITERVRAEEEIRQRNRELAALNAIATVVSQSLNLDEILNAALDKVLELIHLNVGGIYLADPVRRKLDLVVHRGISEEFAHEVGSVSVDEKTLEAVTAEGKLRRFILSVEAVAKDRVELKRILSAMKKEGLSLTSGVPVLLQAREEILGLMIVASRVPRQFSEAELGLLISIGQQITVAVQNARLYEQIRDRVAELASLNLASQTITASLDLQRVLSQIVDLAGSVVNAVYTSVVLLTEDGSLGLSAENFREGPPIQVRARPQGITHQIIASRQPMVFDEVLDDGTHNPALVAAGVRSYAGLPLMVKEKVLGVLFVHSHAPGAFRNRLPLLTTFANQAAIAIENARLYDAVQQELAERKRAEEALRESEEKYRTLAEQSLQGLVVIQDFHIVFANTACAEISGYTVEELLSLSPEKVQAMIHPEDQALVWGRFRDRLAGKPVSLHYEYRGIRKGGTVLWLEMFASRIEYRGKPAIQGAIVDITERKRAEEALRESEEKLKEAQALGRIGNWEFDIDNQKIDWSDETYRLYERDPAFGPPTVEEEAAYYSPEQVEILREYTRRAIEEGEEFEYDLQAKLPSGKPAHFSATMRPVKDESGRIVKLFGTVQDITERKRAEEELLQRQLRLSALNRMGRALAETFELVRIYRIAYEHVAQLVDCPCFGISLYDPPTRALRAEFMLDDGELIDAARFPPMVMGIEPTQGRVRAIITRQPEIITDFPAVLEKATDSGVRVGVSENVHDTGAAMYVPMVARGQVIGLLEVQSYRLNAYSAEHAALLGPAANQIGLSIQNARLYEEAQQQLAERKRAQEELRHTAETLRKTLGATIQAMAFTVETRDPYTAGHQRQVANLARAMATEMGLSKEQIEGIRMAAVIHDMGKITVPTDILNKPGRLNEHEFGIIKAHPEVAYNILKTIEFPWPIAQIIFQHHERMDGSGYPQGLSGEEIIVEARVLAVADVVEAMASFRPYRPALGIDKALEEISQNKGVLYDPEVVDACLKLFTEKGFRFE